MIPGLLDPKGTIVGLSFVSVSVMLLIIRTFPLGPTEDRANALVATLPRSRRQVITARYVLVTALVVILALVLGTVSAIQPNASFGDQVGVAAVFIVAPLLNMVVIGPLSSRGGLGPVGPAIPMVVFAGLMFAAILLPESWRQAASAAVAQDPAFTLGAAALVLALLLASSYSLSVRLFERRDL